MDAVAVVMIGVGSWLMYASYKNANPLQVALHILSPKTTPAPASKTSTAATASASVTA